MSLYGMMKTSASGMAAQASRLGTVSDNIANSATTGYKKATTEFQSIVLESTGTDYASGNVQPQVRYGITEQGVFKYTSSTTDLAVQGEGFFVVSDPGGKMLLTRAGSFIKDGTGNLVNAAGFALQGYPLTNGATTPVANGFAGLVNVNVGAISMQAVPTEKGTLVVNLPISSSVVAATDLPSQNAATASYSAKSSVVVYDNVGQEVTLDVYYTKSAANTWELSVFDRANATSGGFPYSAGPIASMPLTFSAVDGSLTSTSNLSVAIPNGQTMLLDISKTTELAAKYTVNSISFDGNAPSDVDRIEVTSEGIMSAVFKNGSRLDVYKVPLATCMSPDNLIPLAGNVFSGSTDSGDVRIGEPGKGSLGRLVSSALEQSTVDLASELTTMIESQRSYQANSKVFQTGADLMDVLVNMVR